MQTKIQIHKYFFQILWKSRCNILVSFPSHLKKLRSILRFLLEKLNCGFFPLVSLEKKHHKTTFPVKISVQKITIVCCNYIVVLFQWTIQSRSSIKNIFQKTLKHYSLSKLLLFPDFSPLWQKQINMPKHLNYWYKYTNYTLL